MFCVPQGVILQSTLGWKLEDLMSAEEKVVEWFKCQSTGEQRKSVTEAVTVIHKKRFKFSFRVALSGVTLNEGKKLFALYAQQTQNFL